MKFGFLTLGIILVILFVLLFCLFFFIFNKRQSDLISLLSAIIPPVIIIAIIITVGDFLWRLDSRYVAEGKGIEHSLYQISMNTDIESDELPTPEDVCFTYLRADYYEEVEEQEHSEEEENGEEGGNHGNHESGHSHDYSEPLKKDIEGDLCISKNLIEIQTGYDKATVAVFDAKPNPLYPLSMFSFDREDKFYLIRLP